MTKSHTHHIFFLTKILLTAILLPQTIVSKLSFDGLYSKLFSKPLEKVIHKNIPLEKNKTKQWTLSLENKSGNIHIKTEWQQDTVALKATKRISKKEDPDDILIQIQKDAAKNHISIKTAYKEDKVNKTNKIKGSVDYELIIPQNIIVDLKTDKGEIKIKKAKGPITASTNKGDIKIIDTQGEISAEANQGNILVDQSLGNISAVSSYGDIQISDASQSIKAHTKSGSIKTSCKTVPSTGAINLVTNSGSISLALPITTNAELKARAAKGKVTSDHYIEIKPQTVQLNKKTWDRFKREVDGTLGSGEATIELTTHYGNIKILKESA